MASRDGGPAYPVIIEREDGGVRWTDVEPGMTLRDYFAGQALVGIYAEPADGRREYGLEDFPWVARWAYQQADAMLAAREASNG